MPGAFAHITAANVAISTNELAGIDMPDEAKLILSKNVNFVELGCVSPDYPYLAIADAKQNKWADLMHYDRSGDLIKLMAEACKTSSQATMRIKTFAWLCGYLSHVIADITIHPVVELKVGPYEENKDDHRTCEMNQDAYIWQRLKLGEIGLADRVERNIGRCAGDDGTLDSDIVKLWGTGLNSIHSEYAQSFPPEFDKWHGGFQAVVNNAEEGYRFFKWARHVAADSGLLYPRPSEVNPTYIDNLETPSGAMHYDQVFDMAVENIKSYIGILGRYIFSEGSLDDVKNWNLDTGKDDSGRLTVWN